MNKILLVIPTAIKDFQAFLASDDQLMLYFLL